MVATACSRVTIVNVASRSALVKVASKLAGASVLDESERQVFGVVEVIQDLLGTERLGRSVGVENFYRIGERGPEILKEAIEDVFKRVTSFKCGIIRGKFGSAPRTLAAFVDHFPDVSSEYHK
jgi:hypothetical protein